MMGVPRVGGWYLRGGGEVGRSATTRTRRDEMGAMAMATRPLPDCLALPALAAQRAQSSELREGSRAEGD